MQRPHKSYYCVFAFGKCSDAFVISLVACYAYNLLFSGVWIKEMAIFHFRIRCIDVSGKLINVAKELKNECTPKFHLLAKRVLVTKMSGKNASITMTIIGSYVRSHMANIYFIASYIGDFLCNCPEFRCVIHLAHLTDARSCTQLKHTHTVWASARILCVAHLYKTCTNAL